MSSRLLLSIVLSGAALVPGCAREVGSEAPPESRVESRPAVASPVAAATESRLSFQTHLYSERDADLYNRLMVEETAGVGTPVTAIHVEVGDRVKSGQLLATLDDADARLEVRAAEPEAEITASNLRRIEELRKTGVVSEAEHEEAVFESRTAEAALEKAKLNLSRTQVRAPFAGIVSRRYVRVGDIVDDKMPLFRVTAMSPLRARLLVPESEVASFGVGAAVQITGADGATGEARVILVGPTTDPGSGTREVIVELLRAGDFRPGASVSVTAELAIEADTAGLEEGTDP